MRTLQIIALTAAVVLIPVSIFAIDKYDTKTQEVSSKKESSFLGKFMHDDEDENEMKYFQEKGINYVFEGIVEKKPIGKLNGVWTISGIKVISSLCLTL